MFGYKLRHITSPSGEEASLPTLVHAQRQARNYSFQTITTGLTLPKACKPHPSFAGRLHPLRGRSEVPPWAQRLLLRLVREVGSLGPEGCYGAAGRATPGRRCPTITTPPLPRKARGQPALRSAGLLPELAGAPSLTRVALQLQPALIHLPLSQASAP